MDSDSLFKSESVKDNIILKIIYIKYYDDINKKEINCI